MKKEWEMGKLIVGYWGSNMETLALVHEGHQAVVDDLDHGMPEQGGTYRIGIYKYDPVEYDGEEAIEMVDGKDFDIDRVSQEAVDLINNVKNTISKKKI